ncbi:FAD-dependent monooxygenase [Mycobacterium stomatepiae]|uniref:FAD-dependent oxidoreductase n=1 Tax=Mycobacterium stomatepiae TaxID=470076 RepID=A0A7I7Q261_9MYCO|nr:FAD-dependent monooxygenase [Mycobacterium stomatepiae]MCV7165315.1 FAD-dependent monooxygenase [Mycobacterium stomatepiae]BBY20435.1 FAD-dependent oxidoreductase [Mycobacterium stomatepiae]
MIDVVIAGGGPNGLMLASELGLNGIRPVVLDPMPGPNPMRRANGVIGQGVRILDHRGLYGTLAGTADPPRLNPRPMFAAFPLDLTSIADSQVFLLPVQQPRLVQVLADRAGEYDVDIRWGHGLTGFDQDADGVTVQVTGPGGSYALRAKYLIGADGGTSMTRKLAGIEFPGMSSYDLVARMGFDILPPADWIDPVNGGLDIPGFGRVPPLQFHRADQGVFAYGALGGRAAIIVFELDRAAREEPLDDDGEQPPMSLAELEASAKRVLGADVPLRPASPDAPLDLRRFCGINSRIASRYQVGRVILVGDAAHVHSPMGGPGLNLGLQDAVNLGWKLAAVLRGRVEPTLLSTYEAERRPAAERVIMHSRAQLALVRPGPEVSALRQLFSELLTDSDIARRLSNLISGAENRYGTDPDAHPLTGHWVPDFGVTDGGWTRRVAELARTGRPVLIDLTDSGCVAAAVADAADELTVAVGRPDAELLATALLVRPDGYVAWASSAASPDVVELREALARWFGLGATTWR